MTITANMVKELRDKTGAGMMECKKALADTGGDFDKAVNLLRQKGVAVAAKRESRATNEGTIGAYGTDDGKIGTLVELGCETSFVAKTDQFVELAQNLAKQVASAGYKADVDILDQPYIAEPAVPVKDALTEIIGKLGEKLVVSRVARVEAKGCGIVGQYLHTGGQIGVLVELSCDGDCPAGSEDMKGLARDIAMQVAWGMPQYLRRDEISTDKLDQEREVHRQWAIKEGKPEAAIERIVTGRLEKYYEEVVLLDQPFIRDSDLKISDVVKQTSAKVGCSVDIKQVVRFRVGEQA